MQIRAIRNATNSQSATFHLTNGQLYLLIATEAAVGNDEEELRPQTRQ